MDDIVLHLYDRCLVGVSAHCPNIVVLSYMQEHDYSVSMILEDCVPCNYNRSMARSVFMVTFWQCKRKLPQPTMSYGMHTPKLCHGMWHNWVKVSIYL
jgi:hypothetical protein